MLTISAIHNKEISRHDTPWPYTYMTWYSIQPAQDQHLQGTMKYLERKRKRSPQCCLKAKPTYQSLVNKKFNPLFPVKFMSCNYGQSCDYYFFHTDMVEFKTHYFL